MGEALGSASKPVLACFYDATSGAVLVVAKLLLVAACILFAVPASAQSTFTYVVTNDGTINGSIACTGSNRLVRNFVVSDSFTISDVDLGFFATHTWRGDIRITLESPAGTRVQLVDGDPVSTSGNNLNVRLDDSATVVVNSTNLTTNQSTAAPPPFQHQRRPNAALSTFNGENSNGTWRMEMCERFPGADNGTFRHAELYLTDTAEADLSLNKTLVSPVPSQGGATSWTLTVTNSASSSATANSIVVQENLPAGFTLTTTSGAGSYNTTTNQWNVGNLAPGASASLTINGNVTASTGSQITNTAEIIASSVPDPDSTVNNGNTSEDDFATSVFTVQPGRSPGVPPVLTCPVGITVFDWSTISGWTPGSTNNTYAYSTFGNINFQLANDGIYVTSATHGGASPNAAAVFSGGLGSAQPALNIFTNQANQAGEVVTTITLPRSFTGVQFTIFDVDAGADQFADRVEVTGSNGGSTVLPTLTNGNVNFISGGNVAIGDGASGNNEALGNVVVTFIASVDTIVIRHGSHTTAPPDPAQTSIGIHDISVCDPFTTLNVSKVSSVIADPFNGTTNPKAIPGATLEYLITVSNTGSDTVDANSVVVHDTGPSDAKMCLITRNGGPVIFADPGSNSGLSYDYGGAGTIAGDLAVTSDDLEFSDDGGSSFNYVPSADGDGCDDAVTDFRVNPGGAFSAGGTFTLTVRYQVM